MAAGTVLTSKGRDIITKRLIGAPASATEPLNIGWGTGANPGTLDAAVTDIGPFIEASEARVAGSSSQVTTSTTNDTYQVTGTLTAAGAKTINEVFLGDSTTKPFSTTWSTAPTTTAGTTGTAAASFTPANGTYVQCEGEVMQVTAGTGTTGLTVARAQNGSTAATHGNGTTITAGNIPGGSAITGGSVFLHGDFTGVGLSTNDSIAFTIKVQLQ